jgi:hypothetical protein
MWMHEYEATTTANPGAVWRVLADVNNLARSTPDSSTVRRTA